MSEALQKNKNSNPFASMAPQGAYVHIPFCLAKCDYCDFLSFGIGMDSGRRSKLMRDYFEALTAEIHLHAQLRRHLACKGLIPTPQPLRSLYFGGGTPSLAPPAQIQRVINAFRHAPGLTPDAEITLEANPAAVEYRDLCAFRDAGVNRISLGIQSLQNELLERLGRLHSREQAIDAIRDARRAGFDNLSTDLMLALPGQTEQQILQDAAELASFHPEHISFYSLIIEEGTPFYERYAGEAKSGDARLLPDAESERRMYHGLRRLLMDRGYEHYEISNLSLPGRAARHNSLYWRAEPYYAYGLGASAYLDGVRLRRTPSLKAYLDTDYKTLEQTLLAQLFDAPADWIPYLQKSSDYYAEAEVIDGNEAENEFFLLGFRMLRGVSLHEFQKTFGHSVPAATRQSLTKLSRSGLLVTESCREEKGGEDERYRLSERGLDFANEVFMEFV